MFRDRDYKITHVGQQLMIDMHYGRFDFHKELHERYEVRSAIEFQLKSGKPKRDGEKQDVIHGSAANYLAADAFVSFLERVSTQMYCNKILVVIAEPGWKDTDKDWWTVAYTFDGRLAGIAQIRQKVNDKAPARV